jgi:hypothetical protein
MGPLVDLGFICIQNLLILEISGQDGNVLVVLTTIFGRDSTWICQFLMAMKRWYENLELSPIKGKYPAIIAFIKKWWK